MKKNKKVTIYIIILIALLLAVIKLYSYKKIRRLTIENKALKVRVKSLKKEINGLKETASYRFKKGIEYIEKKKYEDALESFQKVIKEYPGSKLVRDAKKKVNELKLKLKQLKQRQIQAELKRQEQEKFRVRSLRETVDEWQRFVNDEAKYKNMPTTWKFKCEGVEYIKTVQDGGYPFGYIDYKKLKVIILGKDNLSYDSLVKKKKFPRIGKGHWIIVTGKLSFASKEKYAVYIEPIKITNKGYKG